MNNGDADQLELHPSSLRQQLVPDASDQPALTRRSDHIFAIITEAVLATR